MSILEHIENDRVITYASCQSRAKYQLLLIRLMFQLDPFINKNHPKRFSIEA